MNTQWLNFTSDGFERVRREALRLRGLLAEPRRQRQLKAALYGAVILWMLLVTARLLWSLVPEPARGAAPTHFVNPPGAAAAVAAAVDIDQLVSWNLFGTVESKPVAGKPDKGNVGDVEDTARETRLNLKLRGIVASADLDLARAVIEINRKQKQYRVGDKLPLSGTVTVAKILPDRVVLSNSGQYELLLLFDRNSLPPATPAATPAKPASSARKRTLDQRGNREVTEMAEAYRQRLYTNPQSLSNVVRIAAVRENGQLRGYRVSAGSDRKQFENLGFKTNDIVIGVNGVELTDPGRAMELYRIMRTAEEASFNVLRGGEELTLVVGLGPATQ